MNTHDIELPEHDCLYESTNEQGYIDLEPAYRKSTVLGLLEADRQQRGEPVAWMPIETAPEEGCWALVCGDGAVDCMFIRKGHVPENWTNPNNPNLNPSEVTHWMSIPEFAPQPAEPVVKESLTVADPVECQNPGMGEHACANQAQCWEPCGGLGNSAEHARVAEPVKRKRRYAQGTALGEFGIIPMCDQVNDEPVVANAPVPSDAEILACLRPLYSNDVAAAMGAEDDLRIARLLLSRYAARAAKGE